MCLCLSLGLNLEFNVGDVAFKFLCTENFNSLALNLNPFIVMSQNLQRD